MLDVTGRVLPGERTEAYVAVVVRAGDKGKKPQPMCTEMLHWDDYKRQRGISDGTPTMAAYFGSAAASQGPVGATITQRVFVVQDKRYSTEKVIAAFPSCAGSPRQMLCAEMIHWDELREARGLLAPGEERLSVRFNPEAATKTYQFFDMEKRTVQTFKSSNVPLAKSANSRRYCTEMEHFDDYCAARGQPQPTPMLALFGTEA